MKVKKNLLKKKAKSFYFASIFLSRDCFTNCSQLYNFCRIVDDIADTAGTLCNAADALKAQGASKVYAYIVHPVLSGNAIEKISQSKLDQLVVTDTIPLSEEAQKCKKIRIVTMAPTLAEAIRRVNNEESISAMFL